LAAPDGLVMPWHAARMLRGLNLPSVRDAGLRDIWLDSPVSSTVRAPKPAVERPLLFRTPENSRQLLA
jgi:hypothetical protein